ncbi:hypothetical protein PPERSA_01076 [Pseudocohnilembus persalinus]|uniref:CSC1/OSCA1-like cytosolic domain-containing protein n=1 Tax=Pseudocohnilembus persalinus TaxID=266149 RepID=A0A0V0QUV9_PSEPJ|nr:hypothetical protein PPERSA_01076 [Pseudocohnilembus persalinus]|eukprot:KRX05998.1 hypothetical protein PPERSA_01076 [Pseudocohnilembus persalinus]
MQNIGQGVGEILKKTEEDRTHHKKIKKTTIFEKKNFILPSNHTEEQTNSFFKNSFIHGLSCRVGDEEITKEEEGLREKLENEGIHMQNLPIACRCCGRYVQKQELSLITSETTDLDFLGPGYPLFFEFIRYSAIFLCVLILSIGSYNFFSNGYLNGCTDEQFSQNQCERNWISIFSLPNKRFNTEFNDLQEILDLFSIVALIFMLQFFRKNQNQIAYEADNMDISQQDYSIIIKGLPKFENSKTKFQLYTIFQEAFKEEYQDTQFTINDIDFTYSLDFHNQAKAQLEQKISEYQQALSKFYQEGENDAQLPDEQKYIDAILEQEKIVHKLERNYRVNRNNPEEEDLDIVKQFTGVCFVRFQSEQIKEKVLKNKEAKLEFLKQQLGEEYEIKIDQGPDPTDVIWENLGKPGSQEQKMGYLKSIGALIAVMAVGFICVIYFSHVQLAWQIEQDPSMAQVCNDNIPEAQKLKVQQQELSIDTQNYIDHSHTSQQYFVEKHHLDGEEKGYFNAYGQYIASQKVLFMTYFISYFFIPFVNYIIRTTIYMTTKFECHETQTDYQISMARKLSVATFFTMGLQTLIIKVILKWSQSCLEAGRVAIFQQVMNRNKCTLTQNQANQLYQKPVFDIAQRYAYLINTLFLTALYAPLLPIGLLISLIGILIIFYIEKYKVLHLRFISHNLSPSLSTQMTELLEYFLPLYCLSDMFFEYMVVITAQEKPSDDVNPIMDIITRSSFTAQIGVILGIVHLLLPMQKINEFIFRQPPALANEHDYAKASFQFSSTYAKQNPITSFHARQEQLKSLHQGLQKV